MYRPTIDLGINARRLELLAGATIYPGMLLIRWPENLPLNYWVAPHWFTDGAASPLIAMETDGKSLDEPYFEGDLVPAAFCLPGDVYYGLVEYEGTPPWPGVMVTSAGNGYVHPAPVENYSLAYVGIIVGEIDPVALAVNGDSQLLFGRVPIEIV